MGNRIKTMRNESEREIIESAIAEIAETSPHETDGKWLENLIVRVAPLIRDWDIERAWLWAEWPYGEANIPDYKKTDVGIDVVAMRRSDKKYIAIQSKSRKLDADGRGNPIDKDEIDSFASASIGGIWRENWLVSNCDVGLGSRARQTVSMRGKPVKIFNIARDLAGERESWESADDFSARREDPDDPNLVQSKTSMQNEAVAESVRILREHADSESGGSPRGEARGKIILPCGTGKTRISLRIVEELTPPGEVSVVLCPSIALVAQIRREYLQNAAAPMNILAVCSDETAGYNPKKEDVRNSAVDPTIDKGSVGASEIKGRVTTDAAEIAAWMRSEPDSAKIKVLIGTYQSSVRVSEALLSAGVRARVLIADEAHRTAGLKRRKSASAKARGEEKRLRDFTVCHDRDRFPAAYRVYQTATPRIYDANRRATRNPDWIVRSMDDETDFGVELYRKSYLEAVDNGWLADYRIIALGVNDAAAFEVANELARGAEGKGRRRLTTANYMRGLAFALAMGGATQSGEEDVDIRSCIAFMNTVDNSKNMARGLQTDEVRNWVDKWLSENAKRQAAAENADKTAAAENADKTAAAENADKPAAADNADKPAAAADYALEHLDASSNAAARESAKTRLAEADSDSPHGIINVGIFGEGTDSPSLSAVAFLEPRKSPIDVVQAVGRAMRTAPGKKTGYIICPVLFPPDGDPESWLATSSPDEGWQELGQILLALRAHDRRIEDELSDLLILYMPEPPPLERAILAVVNPKSEGIEYCEYEGPVGAAQEAVERMLKGESREEVGANRIGESPTTYETDEPTQIVSGKNNDDGSTEIRIATVARDKPKSDGERGAVDIEKTKTKARKMINGEEGITPPKRCKKKRDPNKKKPNPRRTSQEVAEESAQKMLALSGMGASGAAIKMNLLAQSGLARNRVDRDLNILRESVDEASHHLRADGLLPDLNRHFGLDRLKTAGGKKTADGCAIAALLMMNAAMLHQRIANGRWLPGVRDLAAVKNDVNVVRAVDRQWRDIMSHDFLPVLKPAVDAIAVIEDTRKLGGLERALRHVAAEAQRIAETYADMGADHAGPLFNRVMGNQASDGAFFTRPAAASLAARLTLDAVGETDWTSPAAWRELKTVDLACGSGTLLAAILTDMKRRAAETGADGAKLAELQKLAVEDAIKGMDINPVSLQLAASQLTAGNRYVSYRRMGLHQMPYGPDRDNPARISSGSLELLGQKAIVSRRTELNLADDVIASQATWDPTTDVELEDAVEAARDARIIIMNPPFTKRVRMGEKFPEDTRKALRERTDQMRGKLTQADPDMVGFLDKSSIAPLFVGLADHCLNGKDGVLSMIHPTIALSAPSAFGERLMLARRYHVHTVLTCHDPKQTNLSQNTSINESVIVVRRHEGPKPPTRFINLDKLPSDDGEVDDFHRCLMDCDEGLMANGWGEVSYWPAERLEAGDWTPAVWRSPSLAEAAARYANDEAMTSFIPERFSASHWARKKEDYTVSDTETPDGLGLIASNRSDRQTRIQGKPDEYWIPKDKARADEVLEIAGGYLLITAGHDSAAGRLVAVADETKRVSNEQWLPVKGLTLAEAKALAVFYNSTPGRIQLMRNAGRKLTFPQYRSPTSIANVRIPNIKDAHIQKTLAACWERTKDMPVPQFRDGDGDEGKIRAQWDNAVAEAMGWDADELSRIRRLLHREPHVRGLGYNQYGDAGE